MEHARLSRSAFDMELLTIASVLNLKAQKVRVAMKIGREFNTKEIVNIFVDMVRMWGHRHEAFDMYRKEFAGHLLAKPENNRGVSVYKIVLQCSEVLLSLYRVQS